MKENYIISNDTLFVLYASKMSQWSEINSSTIQRILYFCAILSPLVSIPWIYNFSNTIFGPFNGEINLSLKNHVLNGYAKINNVYVNNDSKVRGDYKILDDGISEVEKISMLGMEKERLNWIILITQVLDIYGPKILSKLALCEPFYSQIRLNRQRHINIDDDNQSIVLIGRIKDELAVKHSIELDTTISKIIFYFDYLSNEIG
jgi:hypothetical protein